MSTLKSSCGQRSWCPSFNRSSARQNDNGHTPHSIGESPFKVHDLDQRSQSLICNNHGGGVQPSFHAECHHSGVPAHAACSGGSVAVWGAGVEERRTDHHVDSIGTSLQLCYVARKPSLGHLLCW